MIQISHKRSECIGCDACVEAAPNYWKMDEDGLASLIKIKSQKGTMVYGEGFNEDKEELTQSAESCPVDIIRIS
jgi:ferredoxin